MSKKITLYTTVDDFEKLHEVINSHRANAKEIKVPRQTFMNLLMDHSKMCKELGL
jgi:hypothetical protein